MDLDWRPRARSFESRVARSSRSGWLAAGLHSDSRFRSAMLRQPFRNQRLPLLQDKSKTILITDDDSVTCELLCEVFEREGFKTLFAQSGEEALAVLENNKVDVLVSDI